MKRNSFLAVCALLGFVAAAHADDLQDAQKLYDHGSYAEALDLVGKSLGADPGNVQDRFLKGLILMKEKKESDAIAVFSAITDDHPEYPQPYNNLAVIYAGRGDYERARSALLSAIAADPQDAMLRKNLGDLYGRLAIRSYTEALGLKSDPALEGKLRKVESAFGRP